MRIYYYNSSITILKTIIIGKKIYMFSVIFPGQGSQSVGMAKELHSKFDLVKKYFKHADEVLDFPISKIILEGPKEN